MGKFSSQTARNARKGDRTQRTVQLIAMSMFTIYALAIIIPARGKQGSGYPTRDFTPAPKMPHLRTTSTDENDNSCQTFQKAYPDLASVQDKKRPKRKKYAVVTYSDGKGANHQHYCKVRANHCAYAEKQPQTDCIDNRNLQMCVDPVALQTFHLIQPAWAKVSLLQYCCRYYEYLIMLDSDMLVMDPDPYPLQRFRQVAVKSNRNIVMSGSEEGQGLFNTGIIALRCPLNKTKPIEPSVVPDFLSRTMALSQKMTWKTYEKAEEKAMLKAYNESIQVQKQMYIVSPGRLTQCDPKVVDCSLNDFTVRFRDSSKYSQEFLQYFCQSRTDSPTITKIREKVCSS